MIGETIEISIVIKYAQEEAARMGSMTIKGEHLLLGILRCRNCLAVRYLQRLHVNVADVKKNLEALVAAPVAIPYDKICEIELSQEVQTLYETACASANSNSSNDSNGNLTPGITSTHPDTSHLLLALMTSTSGIARDILKSAGLDELKLVKCIAENSEPIPDDLSSHKISKEYHTPSRDNQLESFGRDLTREAHEGTLDPVIGRDNEILRLAQILCRRRKNNPVLVGDAGSGKSAIVEGLAQRIAAHDVPAALFDKKIISLEMGSLVAGTKYRGEFEERVKSILTQIKDHPEIILFIDEIHTIVGAGSSPGSLDAANLLKPALSRGEIQCIGATTPAEYRNSIEKDAALERRFQRIQIDATDFDSTLAILKGLAANYGRFHGVTYSEEALKACITLSQRYISERCLPDKAIDVMDEAGSTARVRATLPSKEIVEIEAKLSDVRARKRSAASIGDFTEATALREQEKVLLASIDSGPAEMLTVTEEDIASAVATMTNIPINRIAQKESERLMQMDTRLRAEVIGQDAAVDTVVRSIRRNRAGLKDPYRPVGSFLFLGPTGVGKTLLAKKIAEFLFGSAENVVRIDMSEYLEKFSVSRLLGAPPGYVGYSEGGELTEAVRRKPYCVVLLDEIEKAHPDIFNILLQVLDEGRLTDSTGRHVDFRNAIIIMTSNVGSREIKEFGKAIGFANSSSVTADEKRQKELIDKALSHTFTPEFLNRIDEKVYFNTLGREQMRAIVALEMKSLFARLAETGFTLEVEDPVMDFLSDEGYDTNFGARPMKRAIQKYIEDPVSELIISGAIRGSIIRISLSVDGIPCATTK